MKIQIDKCAHLLGGYAVVMTLALVSTPLTGLALSSCLWGFKELVDAMGYGTPDLYDFIASAVWAVMAFGFLMISM